MTKVTEVMREAGRLAIINAPTTASYTHLAMEAYLAMEAARIPASAPDAVERVARVLCNLDIRAKCRHDTDADKLAAILPAAVDYAWHQYVNQAEAALSAIPIPAPTGEVEKLTAALAHIRRLALSDIGATFDLILGATDAALTDHTTKDDE